MSVVRGRLTGAKQLRRRLQRAAIVGKTVVLNAEEDILRDEVFPETQRQVPEDTGLLASTGRIIRERDEVAIAYGEGGAEAYAAIQHERDDFNHPKPGAKSHYLSDPMNEAAATLEGRLAHRISARDLFGRG